MTRAQTTIQLCVVTAQAEVKADYMHCLHVYISVDFNACARGTM